MPSSAVARRRSTSTTWTTRTASRSCAAKTSRRRSARGDRPLRARASILDLHGRAGADAGRPLPARVDRARVEAFRIGGADFELRPPIFEDVLTKPSISVFATGKRTGKTAVASALARHAVTAGSSTRHRGRRTRRAEPAARDRSRRPSLDARTSCSSSPTTGQHASSDYVEDAVTSGVDDDRMRPRRRGTGRRNDVLEHGRRCTDRRGPRGGSRHPRRAPVRRSLRSPRTPESSCVPGDDRPRERRRVPQPVPPIAGRPGRCYDGRRRFSCGRDGRPRSADRSPNSTLSPSCSGPNRSRRSPVARCSSARRLRTAAGDVLTEHLEQAHGCEVVGHHPSARRPEALAAELAQTPPDHDVLLVELKAAAVDVAARHALGASDGGRVREQRRSWVTE